MGPDFIVIGAMNTGTTSLYHYLSYHQDIYMAKPKELDFFNVGNNYRKGIAHYIQYFNSEKQLKGECSPNYAKISSDMVAERIHQHFPNVKLIYIVRNPIDRFLSQCRFHNLDPNLVYNEIFRDKGYDHDIYITNNYQLHFDRFSRFFKKDKILVVKSEALLDEREFTLKKIFKFLEVDADQYDYSKISFNEHQLNLKKIPTNTIISLNSSPLYRMLRNIFSKIITLKKAYHKVMYNKRKVYSLSEKNKIAMVEYYSKKMKEFEVITGIKFDFEADI